MHSEVISIGESAVADEGAGDAGEGEEVPGFALMGTGGVGGSRRAGPWRVRRSSGGSPVAVRAGLLSSRCGAGCRTGVTIAAGGSSRVPCRRGALRVCAAGVRGGSGRRRHPLARGGSGPGCRAGSPPGAELVEHQTVETGPHPGLRPLGETPVSRRPRRPERSSGHLLPRTARRGHEHDRGQPLTITVPAPTAALTPRRHLPGSPGDDCPAGARTQDEAMARRPGMPPRTTRRHLAHITERLNASSRLWAGVAAAASGRLIRGPRDPCCAGQSVRRAVIQVVQRHPGSVK